MHLLSDEGPVVPFTVHTGKKRAKRKREPEPHWLPIMRRLDAVSPAHISVMVHFAERVLKRRGLA